MAAKKKTEETPDTSQDSAAVQNYVQNNRFQSGGSGGGSTGVSEGYTPSQPNYTVPAQRIEQGLFTTPKKVSVSGIVQSDGRVRPYYNLSTEPAEILGGVDDVQRRKIINTLYSRGWYAGKNKEGGFGDNDREAMQNLLYYSNVRGVSWETMINTISKAPISEGAGRAAQVTSTQDLVEIANRTALSTIGRKLSKTEAEQFSKAYQGAQKAQAAGSAQQAPSADVFFQNRIQKKYGAESEGYKYLTAISNVAKLIEGM
jgi:hypothetical protein